MFQWTKKTWQEIEDTVLDSPDEFSFGFLEWLYSRPVLWDKLMSYGEQVIEKDDPYGFSMLSIITIIEVDSSDSDPKYIRKIDYSRTRDLGRLLIKTYPELADCLWKGEQYVSPETAFAPFYKEELEQKNPKLKGFFCSEEDDPFNNPDYMLFPELKNLPKYEPCEESDTAH